MTDPSMSDTALIDRLAELGEQLERDLADAADGLADAVVARIRVEPSGRSEHSVFARRAGLWSLAAAVVLLVVVLVALPGPRRTIARWFGVGSVRIETGADGAAVVRDCRAGHTGRDDDGRDRSRSRPTRSRTAGRRRRGGRRDRACRSRWRRRSANPSRSTSPAGRQIVARYDVDGRTVLVAVLAGTTDEPAFVKQVGSGQVTAVDVPGADGEIARGVWIDGEPHTFALSSTPMASPAPSRSASPATPCCGSAPASRCAWRAPATSPRRSRSRARWNPERRRGVRTGVKRIAPWLLRR